MKRFISATLILLFLCSLSVAAYGEHWIDTVEEPSDYAFSFAVIGDTQIINDLYPDDYHKIYDYVLENKESKNIQIVLGLGDIVNNGVAAEWTRAYDQFTRLYEADIPHIPIRGNHDNATTYNAFLTELLEDDIAGSYSEWNIRNTYQLHRIGGIDYLFLALDYGPSDAVLEWANGVCEQYPDHNVIVLTHNYLNRNGEPAEMSKTEIEYKAKNSGRDIWEKLVSRQPNIMMVLSGHISDNGIVHNAHIGEHGNRVVEMLIDPQGIDAAHAPTGAVAMFYFSKDGRQLTVQYYSTIQQKFYGEPFTVTLDPVCVPRSTALFWISGAILLVAIGVTLFFLLRRKPIGNRDRAV